MTTTPDVPDQIEAMNDHLAGLRERFLTNGDGELGRICIMDQYPTPLTCTCGHGHNRHSGKPDETRCMSYVNEPDCSCTEFVPASPDVAALWNAYSRLIKAVDIDTILALIPPPQQTLYVREWPKDEQALWDARRDRESGLAAVDELRRRKVALAIVTALVGAP